MSMKKIEPVENNIGIRLKELRLHLGFTQDKFAENLSITGGYISVIEKGKATPSGAVISEIVSAHRVNRKWIESGEGKMFLDETPEEKLVRTYGKNPVTTNYGIAWKNETERPSSSKIAATIEPGPRRAAQLAKKLIEKDEGYPENTGQEESEEAEQNRHDDLISKTSRIITSKSIYNSALERNIEAFHKAVIMEEEMIGLREEMATRDKKHDNDIQELKDLLLSLGATTKKRDEAANS
jgi:transcriptional regulator with XRE-family HTH domain